MLSIECNKKWAVAPFESVTSRRALAIAALRTSRSVLTTCTFNGPLNSTWNTDNDGTDEHMESGIRDVFWRCYRCIMEAVSAYYGFCINAHWSVSWTVATEIVFPSGSARLKPCWIPDVKGFLNCSWFRLVFTKNFDLGLHSYRAY